MATDQLADLLVTVTSDGRTLDDLTATEALDLADRVRAIVAALDAPTPRDRRFAADLMTAAAIIEQRAGIACHKL